MQYEPLYQLSVDGEVTTLSLSAIVSAWEDSLPDATARLFDIPPGASIRVFSNPTIRGTRIR